MESKIEQMEAEAVAMAELADTSRALDREVEKSERDAEVDAELAALKEKARKKQEGN